MSGEIGIVGTGKESSPPTEQEKLNARTKKFTDVVKGVAVAYVGLQLGIAAVRFIGRRLRGRGGRKAAAAQRRQAAASGPPTPQQASKAVWEDFWNPLDALAPATPDGYRPIVTTSLSCSPPELYGILFSSSGTDLYLKQHREHGKQWELKTTPWRWAPAGASAVDRGKAGKAAAATAAGTAEAAAATSDGSLLGHRSVFEWVVGQSGSGGFTRLLTFWNPRKPPSSCDTRCVQRQQFCVYRGGVLVFATAMNMLDIPFKECFTVNSFWRVEPGARPGTTALSIYLKVNFIKRAMGVGGIISATTTRDSTSFYTAFMASVEGHIKALRQQAAAPLPAPLPLPVSAAATAAAVAGGSLHQHQNPDHTGPRLACSGSASVIAVSPFAALGGPMRPTPRSAAAATVAGGAHSSELRQPLPAWKQVRALLVFAVLAFTLLHQLHLGRELAALRGEAGGSGGAAAEHAAATPGAAASGGAGHSSLAGGLTASALGPLVSAAGSAHWVFQAILDRMVGGRGGLAGIPQ